MGKQAERPIHQIVTSSPKLYISYSETYQIYLHQEWRHLIQLCQKSVLPLIHDTLMLKWENCLTKLKAANEEFTALLQAGIMRQSKSSWLSLRHTTMASLWRLQEFKCTKQARQTDIFIQVNCVFVYVDDVLVFSGKKKKKKLRGFKTDARDITRK